MHRDTRPVPYLIILGRTPQLALLELKSAYPYFQTSILQPRVIRVENIGLNTPQDILHRLGGTIKIGEIIGNIIECSPLEIAKLILLHSRNQSIVFGISSFVDSAKVTRQFLKEVKHALEISAKRVRFIEPSEGDELSSVVVQKQHITEVILASDKTGYVIAITKAVQDFEDWNKRDYKRPYADPKHGMLPPKVARIAVNLAMRDIPGLEPGSTLKPTLLDPFCGMGTILSEALLRGFDVYGSDQSSEVIRKARANIEWLRNTYKLSTAFAYKLFVEEATHIDKFMANNSLDAIVTEPFMGVQDFGASFEKIKNVIRGLEKLYIGCLRQWHSILKKSGVIIIALPQYVIRDKIISVKKVVDNCENLGYTRLVGPIEYSRPDAIVRRQFYIFQKK